jgi:hypothetical protein
MYSVLMNYGSNYNYIIYYIMLLWNNYGSVTDENTKTRWTFSLIASDVLLTGREKSGLPRISTGNSLDKLIWINSFLALSAMLTFVPRVLLAVLFVSAFLEQGTVRVEGFRDPIKKVYIIFSNHLDIGYTKNVNGSTSGAVINQYFNEHFPKAIHTANEARAKGGNPYKWMTQSWLVSAFLHCNDTKVNIHGPKYPNDLQCPNASSLAAFEAAVKRKDIVWHAFPFNAEPEMYTPELFDAALNLTFELDDHFGHPRRKTLSQRDVPGLTRAAIPLLSMRGVRAVSVGENAQVAPSAVPPIFLWKDNHTKTEVVGMFHGLGYGGSWPSSARRSLASTKRLSRLHAAAKSAFEAAENNPDYAGMPVNESSLFYVDSNGDMIMRAAANMYDDGPGLHLNEDDGTVDTPGDRNEVCVRVDAAGVALCYAWRIDNSGPHSYEESEKIFEAFRKLFPEASEIVASDGMDDFVQDVLPFKSSLPIISAEIGDTWIMGASADPLKVGLFRAAQRVYSRCAQENSCLKLANNDVQTLKTFERLLIVAGEHTWGWNGDPLQYKSWENSQLQKSLKHDEDFQSAVMGWIEQRSILRNAVAALDQTSTLAKQILAAWHDIEGANGNRPDLDMDGRLDDAVTELQSVSTCGKFQVGFGIDGSIVHLVKGEKVLADENHRIGRIHYQGMDSSFFRLYVKQYIAGISAIWPELTAEGLYKPGLKSPAISSNLTLLRVQADNISQIVLYLGVENKSAHIERGAPEKFVVNITCRDDKINYDLRWFNKTATHIPETIWLSHFPMSLEDLESKSVAESSGRVTLDKLGSSIDPTDVDLGCDGMKHLTCGVHLHAVGDDGVTAFSRDGSMMKFVSLDTALVSIGVASPVPTPLVTPRVTAGVHFALVGNIWNTNYPVWYPFVNGTDNSHKFRFIFEFTQ